MKTLYKDIYFICGDMRTLLNNLYTNMDLIYTEIENKEERHDFSKGQS